MTTAYWAQFSKQEIDSMHGIEPEDYHDDDQDYDHDDSEDEEREEGCSCGNVCMDCLGMSWRDFM